MIKVHFCFWHFLTMKESFQDEMSSTVGFHHIINIVRLRACSAYVHSRIVNYGSYERYLTQYEHTMCTFLIFALPALPRANIALVPVLGASERGQQRSGLLKMASKRPNGQTLVRF